ncbi:MAG: group II truncated hemoglobin [Arenicella sp.]
MTVAQKKSYGQGDATYIAAGQELGVRRIVERFFDNMRDDKRYQRIWDWHPQDNAISRDKLARFLCGWMGGPKIYQEKYGTIHIPRVHSRLPVTAIERDMWLNCMRDALEDLDYPDDFVDYLMAQLSIPAERIRQVCTRHG